MKGSDIEALASNFVDLKRRVERLEAHLVTRRSLFRPPRDMDARLKAIETDVSKLWSLNTRPQEEP